MKNINLFYLTIVGTGIFLFTSLRPDIKRELSFYGVAESRATEINYNYPVVVNDICVKPGQAVKAGDILLRLSRINSKETLEDQGYRIAELKAEEILWKKKLQNEMDELKIEQQTRLAEITGKIDRAQNELDFKKSLVRDLKSLDQVETSYKPLKETIEKYKLEKVNVEELYNQKINGLEQEITLGHNPYREQIRRYIAEKEFDESQKVQSIVVTAPSDGLVGNISCKEAEHISSYSTLLTFYEPHSEIIKGYVHEDLTLEVEIGQRFTITSLKDENINYPGRVIGLGSRIVELPSRLRKIEAIKAYGREVLIEIPKDNTFLQKEKVSITFNSDNNLIPELCAS